MKSKVNDFLDLYREKGFHHFQPTEQVARLVYFHTVIEGRGSISLDELRTLFHFAELPEPRNLHKLIPSMCGRGRTLLKTNGEYCLQRPVRIQLDQEVQGLRGIATPPKIEGANAFEFPGKVFSDAKVSTLLQELQKCYAQQCWNACGILARIIVERTLDSVDPAVKARQGLKDKINFCVGQSTLFSKTMRDGLKELHGTKIIGDIVAHHSSILLDKPDVDLVLPAFRMLLKEVTTI